MMMMMMMMRMMMMMMVMVPSVAMLARVVTTFTRRAAQRGLNVSFRHLSRI